MPPSSCLKRLPLLQSDVIPAVRGRITAQQTASFSSSPVSCYPLPPKKKAGAAAPIRGQKTLQIKKNVRQDTGRRPAPGERKAMRKRIVLSNTNALEVPGLKDLEAASLEDQNLQGQVLGLPGTVVDSLRAAEAFKPTQGWHLFRRPATLMREESAQLAKLVQDAQSGKNTSRVIIAGDRLSGKSTLLLQALTVAFLKGWVVINIPDAKDLVNGQTEYGPLPNTEPLQYLQRQYTASLLGQIAKANASVLSTLNVSLKHDLPIPVSSKMTLERLAELGSKTPDLAWPIFSAFWAELTAEGRPPIMFAIDGVGHIMRPSAYLTPELKPIHAHDLAMVRHFVDHLSGARALPNGGVVLAAATASNNPANPSLEFAIEQNEARQASATDIPQWNPYKVIDQRVAQSLSGVDVLRLKGLSKDEARSIMEYYAASGLVRRTVNAPFVSEKWTLAGNGIIGELERNAVKFRI